MAEKILREIWTHHIFTKLNLKELACCQIVCKVWREEILNPEFVKVYRPIKHIILNYEGYKSQPIPRTYYSVDTRTADGVKLNLETDQINLATKDTYILSSSNGLLLVRITKKNCKARNAIWNPTTKELKFMPECPRRQSGISNFVRPSGRANYVLTYDPSTHDAIVAYFYSFNKKSQLDVYSMKKNSWRAVQTVGTDLSRLLVNSGQGINDIVYWTVSHPHSMIILNIKTDEIRKIPIAEECEDALDLTRLGSSIVIYKTDCVYQEAEAWIMNRETEEFTKLFKISLLSDYPKSSPSYVFFMTDKKVLLLNHCGYDPYGMEFVLVDLETNKRELVSIPGAPDSPAWHNLEYEESLISLKSISG